MSFEIKKLSISELTLAKELIVIFQLDDGVKNPTLPTDEYLTKLLAKDDFWVIVALENEKVIGGLTAYVMPMYKLETEELFLFEIEVEPQYRQKGVARTLIEFTQKLCVERNIKEMFVGTDIDNLAAMKLYTSTGGENQEKSTWFFYKFD